MRDDVYCSSQTGIDVIIIITWFDMNDGELRVDVLRVALQISAQKNVALSMMASIV
jgi:hypothetical protein